MTPYYSENGITIYHGDCWDVLPLLSDCADMMATDPPYGVNWQGKTRRNSATMFEVLKGDDGSIDVVDALGLALKRVKRCGHVYIFGKFDLSRLPLTQSCELIWDKEIQSMGDLTVPWGSQHETITFATYEISKANREVGYGALAARVRKGSVIRVQRVQGGAVTRHPTEKPVLLMRQLIESSSVIGDLVLDPFAGSGSTLKAAQMEGRRAIGIEIEERYCEVAAERLSEAQNGLFSTQPTATASGLSTTTE